MEIFHRVLSEGGILSGVLPLAAELNLFFVQAVIIIATTRVLALLGGYLKQPRVIFEVIGGILLGPSALGRIPSFNSKIFPTTSLVYLDLVANIGLVLYLFLVGMELDPKMLATHAKRAGSIAIIGMAVPFAAGVGAAKVLFIKLLRTDPDYEDVSFTSFFVFVGTAMSITAFPVLARILKETGLIYSRPGVMTMGAAALNDAIAWCLLILAISIANTGGTNMIIAFYVFLCVVCLAIGLIVLIRPILEIIVSRIEATNAPILKNNLFALIIMMLFLSAWTTALLGVHAIFGAFLFGLIIPRESRLWHECNERIEEFVLTIMLPLYFALSGLKTDVTQINTPIAAGLLILVCFVATAGKMLGCGFTAYFSGLKKRESAVVAILMNTRGLVELIVLNLGVSSGILNVPVFSIMVIMALFTTFITCPLVELVYPLRRRKFIKDTEEGGLHPSPLPVGGGGGGVIEGVDVEDVESLNAMERPTSQLGDGSTDILQTKTAKITLVLDRTEHIPGLLDVIYLFAPVSQQYQLAVTAAHFIEPTMTDRDRFLGLGDDGRVIRVEKKTTEMTLAGFERDDVAARNALREYLELLPLSMFCSAIGAGVDVYRIIGDPYEFPTELRRLSSNSGSDLIVMPWRTGNFLEQFFWSSVTHSHCPIALVAQFSACMSLPKDPSAQLHPIEEGDEQKGENDTQPEEKEDIDIDLPQGKSRTEGVARKVIQKLLVIISGSETDTLALLIVQRVAVRQTLDIVVALVGDESSYTVHLKEAIEMFHIDAPSFPNVLVKRLESPFTMPIPELVAKECSFKNAYDMIIVGFMEPVEKQGEEYQDQADADMEVARGARGRSSSISMMVRNMRSTSMSLLEPMMSGGSGLSPQETLQYKISLGMSEKLANSDLTHPELGVLGDRICRLRDSISSFLMVLHAPKEAAPRSSTIGSEQEAGERGRKLSTSEKFREAENGNGRKTSFSSPTGIETFTI